VKWVRDGEVAWLVGCGDLNPKLPMANGWGWGFVAGGRAVLSLHARVAEVRRLVAAGADVEEELGELGLRSLHVAAGYGQVEVLKVLVELGANKEAKPPE
jgi:hypothetical protein